MSPSIDPGRLESCLLAGLLGDAWGGAFEGKGGTSTGEFPRAPTISDDTQLVLATCEAIVERGGVVDPEAVAERFRIWFTSGRLSGVGSSTLKALRDLAAGAHWALAGARGELAAGNGAAMRAAPLAFFLDPALASDRRTMRDVARITHHHDEAYAGCLAMVLAIRCSSDHSSVPTDLLERVASGLPDSAVRDRLREVAMRTPEEAAHLGTSGHVVDAVPLALRIAAVPGFGCEQAIRLSIGFGGDTDTIASMAAQVLGAAGMQPSLDLVDQVLGASTARAMFARVAQLARGS